jgi:1-acyl-sn-glycerol-3-phosphate acyltransferase
MLHGLRPAFSLTARTLYDVHLHHPDRVPTTGPVIFAPNHSGFLDGPLLAIVSPRPVHALTKQEMYDGPMGLFLRGSGQIRLDRFNVDPGAVKACVKVLGAAYLGLVTGAPVVPVVFFGTRLPGSAKSFPPRGSRFDVVYGDPVYLDKQPWPRTRDDVLRATQLLAGHLRSHLDEAKSLTGRNLPGPLPGA